MAINVKEIVIKRIDSRSANAFVKLWHYSGKVVNNSSLHFGAFYENQLHGVLSFGPSFDKTKLINLVENTQWNEFIELNRMAFDSYLPKNSESRCIAICMRLLRKHAPHLKWVVSFADGTQCGDGTMYRASGFHLTGIKQNKSIIQLPSGEVVAKMTYTKGKHILTTGGGAKPPEGYTYLKGFQLRYLYFLKKECYTMLTVPVLPFSEIEKVGAGMYKGKPRVGSVEVTH
jgi:hypothetical protein